MTSTCNAPGPDGLVCDLSVNHDRNSTAASRVHAQDITPGIHAVWVGSGRGGAFLPRDVAESLAALAAFLRAIGDACRAGAR